MLTDDNLGALVEFATRLKLDDIPDTVVNRAKNLLLDTIAVTIAGVSAPGIRELSEQIMEWGGAEQSSVIGLAGRFPAPNAAFLNAAMGHALDYDDTHDDAHTHANICIVPAVLAVSEHAGASGRDLVEAHVVGLEIGTRLALAARPHMPEGWVPTTIFGCLGAAAAAGRLLKLSPEKLRHALGIAYSHAGGNRQGLLDGALTKRIQPGIFAKAGVVSAVLAQRGITGASRILDGTYGLYPLFVGNYNLDSLSSELGIDYELMNIGLKLYPSARGTHAPIAAALYLRHEHDLTPDLIRKVIVRLNREVVFALCGAALSGGQTRQVNAQFSTQYAVACALIRGKVQIEDFQDQAICDQRVVDLAGRVDVVLDTTADVSVEIELTDGRCLKEGVAYAPGHAKRFPSIDRLQEKVVDCMRQSGPTRAEEKARALVRVIQGIESAGDVRQLIEVSGGYLQ